MVVESKKSHKLHFASWRTRKASDIIQSEAKGLRTEGVAGDKSQTLKTLRPGEDGLSLIHI